MSGDRYFTLDGKSTGEVREKASKFFAYAFPIADEEDFKNQQTEIARAHHTARHICHAWVLGDAGEQYRAFDAGEPSGTAGKPILRQLQGADLTYCAIVVVRYFGGTLLGKAGLSHAFADAAKAALAANTITERVVHIELTVQCSYSQVEEVKRDVLLREGEVLQAEYAERCLLRVAVARNAVEELTENWMRIGAEVNRVK
ncbi:MAG: YigZ family protein [Flavobacteriales bacterium]